MTINAAAPPTKRASVYFLSHGGPNSMDDVGSGYYNAWVEVGRKVKAEQPKGIVFVSAHWESENGDSSVLINEDPSNPLIYDFYGFPPKYYKETFETRGSPELMLGAKQALDKAGIRWRTEKRGLDHGVWVCMKIVLGAQSDIPLVQVSLPGDSSPVSTAKLGSALRVLRDQGFAIMGGGQIVHNLRDFQMARMGRISPSSDYAGLFVHAIKGALVSSSPIEGTINLFRHPQYKRAHPTPEHLLPLVFAVGATDEKDQLDEVFVTPGDQAGLGWGIWRWHTTGP